MNPQKTEKLFSLMKQFSVEYLKTSEIEIKMNRDSSAAPQSGLKADSYVRGEEAKDPSTAAAAPPVDMEIPHHENQVAKLLKLNDEQLVDVLFPEGAKSNADS